MFRMLYIHCRIRVDCDLMRERLFRFMQGRYGMDQLGRVILIFSAVMMVFSVILSRIGMISLILNVLGMGGLLITWVRMLSRNFTARSAENRKYLQLTEGLRRRIGKEKYMMAQRKAYHIYKCPQCAQKIRSPRGDGRKIEIECPKCHTKFIKRK